MDTLVMLFVSDTYYVQMIYVRKDLIWWPDFIILLSFLELLLFFAKNRKVKIFAYHRSRYWSKSKVFC